MRDEAWRRRFAMDTHFASAKPGRGHLALASLYRSGKVPAVITQNIDNLHQAVGNSCRRCRRVARQHHLRDLPRLRQTLRIVLGEAEIRFVGGPRPRLRVRRLYQDRDGLVRAGHAAARNAARGGLSSDCDLFIAIGSSLVVWPAAGFPLHAKRNGARLAIINREPTDFDEIADLVVRQDIGEALGPFVAH